jgi:hypothetical protein
MLNLVKPQKEQIIMFLTPLITFYSFLELIASYVVNIALPCVP